MRLALNIIGHICTWGAFVLAIGDGFTHFTPVIIIGLLIGLPALWVATKIEDTQEDLPDIRADL